MSLKNFQILNKIGDGTYSVVYKVRSNSDGNEYALKKVNLHQLSEKERQNALNEVRILASVRHSNIIGYKEVFIDETTSSLCIVMEYANDGDLLQKIIDHQKRGILFQESEIWNIFIQLIKGLKALHDLEIFHRDLKSANVFLNSDGTCKIGDMNVSKIAKNGFLTTQTGTPYYASPEVWKDQPYDSKSDIWSLGCVLYEMITLRPPFRGDDMDTIYRKVIKGYFPRIPAHFSEELNQIIKILLQVSPNSRFSCDKILTLPFILKFFHERHLTQMDEGIPFLLKTIRVPKNLHYLKENLPKPNYIPLKIKNIDKKQFMQALIGDKFDLSAYEETEIDSAKKLLKLIGTKKGSILPRINKNNMLEQHNKRYDNVAPLYEEEIFLIKAIGIESYKKHHNVSKSCNYDRDLSIIKKSPEKRNKRKFILPKLK